MLGKEFLQHYDFSDSGSVPPPSADAVPVNAGSWELLRVRERELAQLRRDNDACRRRHRSATLIYLCVIMVLFFGGVVAAWDDYVCTVSWVVHIQ